MLSKLQKPKPVYAFVISFFNESENPHDDVHEELFPELTDSSGFTRLKQLFLPYYDNKYHPALISILNVGVSSFVMGGIYGGITRSRETFINFLEKNEATQFRNQFDAKRQLSDKMFLSFSKGIMSQGTRISFFCTSCIIVYTLLTFYRNKDSIWHYAAGASCAGALYKFPLGPKGMISGAFFGGFFGCLYGGWKGLMLYVTKMTEEDIRNYKFGSSTSREEVVMKVKKNIAMKKEEKEMEGLLTSVK